MKQLLLFIWICLIVQTSFGQAGVLDPEFGVGGILKPEDSNKFGAMLVQPDGKILVLGSFGIYDPDEIIRLLPDGTLDNTFSNDGILQTSIAPNPNQIQIMKALALQLDGKIIACGRQNDTMLLMRILPNGMFDNSFGTGGVVIKKESQTIEPYSIALQPDGKIVASVFFGGRGYLYRFHTNGQVDQSFGTAGRYSIDSILVGGYKILVDPDSKIVIAGFRQLPGSFNSKSRIQRLLPSGVPDPLFGQNGSIEVTYPGNVGAFYGMAFQEDGKILTVGKAKFGTITRLVLHRYLPDGSDDNNFGSGGMVTIESGNQTQGRSVAIQPDGKIVVTGGSDVSNNLYLTARFNPDGVLDPSFGQDGIVLTDAGTSLDYAFEVAIQPDGKILVGGDDGSDIVLMRYLSGISTNTESPDSRISGLNIYPNPNPGHSFSIDYISQESSSFSIKVVDCFARLVHFQTINLFTASPPPQQIALPSDLKAGTYFLTCSSESGSITFKVILQ